MISKELYDTFENNKCFFSLNSVLPESDSQICKDTWAEINNITTEIVNWYDLYRPVYPEMKRLRNTDRMGKVVIDGVEKTYKKGKLMKEYTPWATHTHGSDLILGYTLTDYINM